MKKIKNLKKAKKWGLIAVALSLILLMLPSCADAAPSSAPLLSPAIDCIAEQSAMARCALVGQSISFSADDFARAVNKSDIEKITLTSLPPISDGELRIGSTVVSSEQTVSAATVSLMSYHPSSQVSSTEFRFRVDESPYELCCRLYFLDEPNYAPTLSVAPAPALEVSTYKNVTYFGTLPCYDPDGDATQIEIVSYPEKGLLVLEDAAVGSYRYIPSEDSVGKDSFCYVARDIYGNYSASREVSVDIVKQSTSVVFSDLDGSPYHNAALAMTERGVMSGTQVGSSTYFYPEKEVSRAEFTVMALEAAGITQVRPVSTTVFADDADIPSDMKGYVATAYELGYVSGIEVDGKLCFMPDKPLTRAEAAVMLGNMLDLATPTVKPTFSDSDDIPVWAQASVYSLSAAGILQSYGGAIAPTASVTRGDAANILLNFMEVRK